MLPTTTDRCFEVDWRRTIWSFLIMMTLWVAGLVIAALRMNGVP